MVGFSPIDSSSFLALGVITVTEYVVSLSQDGAREKRIVAHDPVATMLAGIGQRDAMVET